MDLLSEALDRIELKCMVPAFMELTGSWGFSLPPPDPNRPPPFPISEELGEFLSANRPHLAAMYAVLEGRCEIDRARSTIGLQQGDLLLMPSALEHRVRDRSGSPVWPFKELRERHGILNGSPMRIGGGGDGKRTSLMFGVFFVRSQVRLVESLPEVILLRSGPDGTDSWLHAVAKLLGQAAADHSPGGTALVNRLMEFSFCQVVRQHVRSLHQHHDGRNSWLKASLDEQIGRAIAVLHARLAEPWTVQSVAAEVAMSRSAFAARFTALVGEPPLQYLTQIRMERARELLSSGTATIKEISRLIGYESEAAFSTAFRRISHTSPIDYRRKSRAIREQLLEHLARERAAACADPASERAAS